jgi:cell division protein FtsI (penicillin-binding protein 3)
MNIRKNIILRVYAAFFLLAIVAIAILGRVFQLQNIQGEKWRKLSDSLTTKLVNVAAIRGNIYSSDGSLLATSLPEYELRFDLMAEKVTDEIFNSKVDSLAYSLADLFKDKTAADYERKMIAARNHKDRYFLLKRNVTYLQLKKIRTFPIFSLGKNKGGLLFIQKNKRIQPFKSLAPRLIGYKIDGVQPVGLEGAFDKELGGEPGKRLMQRISGGVWMPLNEEDEIAAKNGVDIISTLDVNYQDVAQKALNQQLIKHDAHHGCVVLMEVATGEIKAIANLTRIEKGIYKETYNYAVGEATEPGSTFKLASYLAALEDGVFDTSTVENTTGGVANFGGHKIKDSHEGGYGMIPMRKAFELSSNVAISKQITNGYNGKASVFINRLKAFGLAEDLPIEIAGSPKTKIIEPNTPAWNDLTMPTLSMGYAILMTPLKTLTFYNAVANNGIMVSPKFVRELRSGGQLVKAYEPIIIRKKIASDASLGKMRKLMEGVVKQGTAKNLSTTIYSIAGKTGTAVIAGGTGGYANKRYLASFCGYFPADFPKYSMIVVITDPSMSGYYGNVVAGPIFKEIADKVYATSLTMHNDNANALAVAIAPTFPDAKSGAKEKTVLAYQKMGFKVPANFEAAYVSIDKNENGVSLSPKPMIAGLVPNVVGMGLQDALYLIENEGMVAVVNGSGKITNQSISAGAKVNKGSRIVLDLR